MCSIRLSKPLLKLRPRKDLVETLLHEMIHAFLFVTVRDRDRDGHGPNFQEHMHRINREAGTKITIYHSFHAEVALYKTHHWRCDGVCRDRKPFFGWVKRASNRAPGPNDLWWSQHQATCGGRYIKVAEPEGYGAPKGKRKGSPEANGEEPGTSGGGAKPKVGGVPDEKHQPRIDRIFGGSGATTGVLPVKAVAAERGGRLIKANDSPRKGGGAKPVMGGAKGKGGGACGVKTDAPDRKQPRIDTIFVSPTKEEQPVVMAGKENGVARSFAGGGQRLGGGTGVSKLLGDWGGGGQSSRDVSTNWRDASNRGHRLGDLDCHVVVVAQGRKRGGGVEIVTLD